MMGEQTLNQARMLVEHIESGDEQAAQDALEELSKLRETDLYRELGKLTRELHDTLNSFKLDSRITDLAAQDIPDAKERLNYVINMTEQAANKTLNAVEESLPVSEQLQGRSEELGAQWERFRRREMSAEEFRELSRELDGYFAEVGQSAASLHSNLSDVLMAQDFQDLTGQIIRRVISLVQDVEQSLVDLVRLSGRADGLHTSAAAVGAAAAAAAGGAAVAAAVEEVPDVEAQGPHVPGIDEGENVIQGQDEVDDLLSSLGF